VLLPIVVACVLAAGAARATAPDGPPYPRLANVYLHGSVDPSDLASLARWDLLVLDSVWSDAQLAALRAYNPGLRIFFYVCAYCTAVPPAQSDEWRMTNYVYAHTNDLWWRNIDGSVASDWPGTRMINITDRAPSGPAGNWRTFLGGRLEGLVGARRMLDGVFFDNFWSGISWEQGSIIRVDSDCSPRGNPAGCDGVMDPPAVLDSLWNGALSDLANDTRQRFDRLQTEPGRRPLAILSNGSHDYYSWLNGTMYEHFPHVRGDAERGNPHGYAWAKQMLAEPGGYLVAPFRAAPYVAPILNAGWAGSWDEPVRNDEFERHKRFTFVSALLGDGYYSLDASTAGHGALWWEPEYDHAGRGKGYLGYPKGPAVRIVEPTGSEHVVNGSWSMVDAGWRVQEFRASGRYERDFTVVRSAPGAARLTVDSVEPGGSLKLYQAVPVLGGFSYTLSFWARTDTPQTLLVHLYGEGCAENRCLDDQRFEIGSQWQRFEVSFIATGNENAGLDFFVMQPGSVWLDDVSLRGGDTTVYRRDFENGIVLLNYTDRPQRVDLGGAYRRLSIPGSPVWDGRVPLFETVPPWDGRILLRVGKPGETPTPEKARTRGGRAALWPADPNPFRPGTNLRFSLDRDEPVRLVIYDVAGRRVRTLASGPVRMAGEHSLRWNGDDDGGRRVPAGIYVARLQTPTLAESRKLTLLP
jgi:hypothetical protein